MHLAWFTPLAPARSGISSYSAMILPLLAGRHTIDVFVDGDGWRARAGRSVEGDDGYRSVAELGCHVRSAHDFLPRHRRTPYDLVVYQLGNAACHDYMWAYLVRVPGLLVLHDRQVHQARARALLSHGRRNDYRAEFAANQPGTPPGAAEWMISGFGNMAAYLWPMTDQIVRASRAVAVHFPAVAAEIAEMSPGTPVLTVRHGAPDLLEADAAGGTGPRQDGRPVTFAAFGLVTPEKRIPQILRALATIRPVVPGVRLALVGATAGHYDVLADAKALGVEDLVEVRGYATDEAFDRAILESDVCLCLRWPTNREASGPWLRCLAAGKPTIVNDLVHLVDVPTLDPRTWEVSAARTEGAAALTRLRTDDAVAVAVDILDEDHSLQLAMRRLALDAGLRTSLGAAARRHWAAGHTLAVMAGDYERAIAAAAGEAMPPAPAPFLPAHMTADGTGALRAISSHLGVAIDLLEDDDSAER